MSQLYSLTTVPLEMTNLSDVPAYAAIRKELTDRLFTILRETGDPRMLEDGKYFETPPARRAERQSLWLRQPDEGFARA